MQVSAGINSNVFPAHRDGKILYVTSARINIPLPALSAHGARRAIFHFNLERCDGSLSTPSMGRNNRKIYELRARGGEGGKKRRRY